MTIEYIANKSKELLANQIDSYRSIHQKSGIIIAIAALFAPLFLFLIEKGYKWIQISSVIIIIPMIIGTIFLLITLMSRKLSIGYDETTFEYLINQEIDYVHKFEIAYNKYSIEKNEIILIRQNSRYNRGILLIIISILLSIGLLVTNTVI